MFRKLLALALFVSSASALSADYQCKTSPQNDLIITPSYVQVVGASGEMKITPQGNITRDGKTLTLDSMQQEKAQRFQSTVRQDLPWIKTQTQEHLKKARQIIDNIVVKQLGQTSNLRKRLTTLETNLNQQINKVIETRPNGYAFHHQAVKQFEQDGRTLVQESLGGMLQDSINEFGVNQLLSGINEKSNGKQALAALAGGLNGLQGDLETEIRSQQKNFEEFGKQVCSKVTNLEQQRASLVSALK